MFTIMKTCRYENEKKFSLMVDSFSFKAFQKGKRENGKREMGMREGDMATLWKREGLHQSYNQ